MEKLLIDIEEANKLIKSGKNFIISGTHEYLNSLEKGNWIGGTTYYCFSGGRSVDNRDFLYVQEIPSYCEGVKIKYYDLNTLQYVYQDMFDNGFSIILIPYESKTHFKYPIDVINYPCFAIKPLIGWIAGVPLDNKSKLYPAIYDGENKKVYNDGAVVMHVQLPDNKLADLKVCNIFKASEEYTLEFNEEGFNIEKVLINGKEQNFVEFIKEKNIDVKFPLVGTLANTIPTIVSFKEIDEARKTVKLYAPVYNNIKYSLAKPEKNYFDMLVRNIPKENNFTLPYICILHHLYGELNTKTTDKIPSAPTTFGEIAHILVNQTLTYLSIYDV